MKIYNKGTSVRLKATFKQINSSNLYEIIPTVTTPLVSVIGVNNKKKLTNATMLKEDDGIYYYDLQTTTSWASGQYSTKVSGVLGTYTGLKIESDSFRII